MKLSVPDQSFLDSFDHLSTIETDEYGKNKLHLYTLKMNANEFDYNSLVKNLLEPVITFSVSRKVRDDYASKPHTLTNKAVSKFVDHCRNTGELGELLLYAFLECHLNAPKILTKLELKTSTNLYVNGSDGVHYLKLPNGNYQLIFGESKTICDLSVAIKDAFTSIYEFKNEANSKGHDKSGIRYEKSLISDNLIKETYSDEDIRFIDSLIYPKKDNAFRVDDAFAIFVGYEISISDNDRKLPNDIFDKKIKTEIITHVLEKKNIINKYIDDNKLSGHCFYIYILPFTNLDHSRKSVLEGLMK